MADIVLGEALVFAPAQSFPSSLPLTSRWLPIRSLPMMPGVPAGRLSQSGAPFRHVFGTKPCFYSFSFSQLAWRYRGSTATRSLGRAAGLQRGRKERGPLRRDNFEFTRRINFLSCVYLRVTAGLMFWYSVRVRPVAVTETYSISVLCKKPESVLGCCLYLTGNLLIDKEGSWAGADLLFHWAGV